MRHDSPRTGVCVVRIERQRSGVLITVRTNADVAQLSAERVIVVADVEAVTLGSDRHRGVSGVSRITGWT